MQGMAGLLKIVFTFSLLHSLTKSAMILPASKKRPGCIPFILYGPGHAAVSHTSHLYSFASAITEQSSIG